MRRLPATAVFYGLEFLLSMPTWVVVAVYLVQELDFSPLQLVLMGTAMEAAVFLCEIPTGVVADTYGRRLSLVIGYLGMGTTWLLVGVASAPWLVIALWAIWGLSYTFTSGSYEAWITDEVDAENVGPIFLRGARVAYAGSFAGLVLLVALGAASLRAAVIAGGAITLACGLACIFVMPETGFRRHPREQRASAFAQLRTTAVSGGQFAWARPIVMTLIAVELFLGMSSESFDRLKEAHFLRNIGLPAVGDLEPVVWFGILALVTMALGFFAVGRLLRRYERTGTKGVARTLFSLTLILLVAQLVFALTGSTWLAIASALTISLARGLSNPLYMTWLNEQITDSSVRATVISLSGQANAVGQAAGGPVLGGIGNVWGIPAALGAGALVISPALALYGRAMRHEGREPELGELAPTSDAIG